MKILKQIILLLVVFAVPANLALAHATPLLYEPEASSVVTSFPALVGIHFSEKVEPKAGQITVYGPDGSRVDVNDAFVDPNDERLFKVALINTNQEGSYTVSWQVVSQDDGHFTQGAYIFSVGLVSPGAAASQSSFQIKHSSSLLEGLSIGFELIGEALLLGLLVVTVFIFRPMRKKGLLKDAEKLFLKRLNLGLILSAALAFLGGASYFVFKTQELARLQNTDFIKTLWVFLSTVSAQFTVYRLLAVLVFFLVFWFYKKVIISNQKLTKLEIFLFLLLVFTAFSRAYVSHAAASTFYPMLSVIINFIHLYFKDLWIGGLLALLILFSPIVKSVNGAATLVLKMFSRITIISLAVAGVTGTYVIWLHLKSFDNVFITDWGKKFVLLSIFAGGLFVFRMLHQLFLKNLLVRRFLPYTLVTEGILGVFILLITGNLIITTPPLIPHYNFLKQTQSQGVNISLSLHPYEANKLLVSLGNAENKQSIEADNVLISLTNEEQNIGPVNAIVEQRFVGGYVLDETQLNPKGNWQINVTAQRQGAYDAVASFAINYPEEINAAKTTAQKRGFGQFEIFHILIALAILVVATLLYKRNESDNGKYSLDSFYMRGAWVLPAVIGLLVLFLFSGNRLLSGLLKSNFQKLCEKNQNITFFAWHESVPMRAGQATSDIAAPGCMMGFGAGQYHFSSEREFSYFTRPVQAKTVVQSENLETGKESTLLFKITDLQDNPIKELSVDHDRILHAVIISSDFSVFDHVHVEDSAPVSNAMLETATFPVKYTFPKAGRYLVAVDFSVRAKQFSEVSYVNVTGSPLQEGDLEDFSLSKNFEGFNVTLNTPSTIKSREVTKLKYYIEQNGQPVKDLEAYLTVPMHISIASEDLSKFIHTHGLLPLSFLDKITGVGIHAQHFFMPSKFGPNIEASVTFPKPGVYHVFGEFKQSGKVIKTHFVIRAE